MTEKVRTVCQACQCECGVLVHVEDGMVVKIEGDPNHPLSRGFICVKGSSYHEFLYHTDRLTHPMKRSGGKGKGACKKISWDEALDEITEKLTTTKEKYGYDPLPVYNEPPESPLSTPALLKDYPLILITGARHINYFHSEGRQVKSLRNIVPDPEVEIHPDTARELDIKSGSWVWVETPQVKNERIRLKAKLTSRVDTNVVHARHGWWFPEKPAPEHGCFESNIDVVLSGDPPREPICGSVPTRGTLCRVYADQTISV